MEAGYAESMDRLASRGAEPQPGLAEPLDLLEDAEAHLDRVLLALHAEEPEPWGSLVLDRLAARGPELAPGAYLALLDLVHRAAPGLLERRAEVLEQVLRDGTERLRSLDPAGRDQLLAFALAHEAALVEPALRALAEDERISVRRFLTDLLSAFSPAATPVLVARLRSAAMAQALGLARERVNSVALAALCHDLGKEKMPPEILNKPFRLTPEKSAVMARHPVEGARLLLRLGRVDPLLPVVAHQHHRGVDGQGYPADPTAGRVHPVSLLVSVADVYDALRTARPYRAARSAEEAFNVLLADAGRGHLPRAYVSTLAGILGLLGPGRPVCLGDGRRGVVVEAGLQDALCPAVQTDDGTTVDLARERGTWLAALQEPELGEERPG